MNDKGSIVIHVMNITWVRFITTLALRIDLINIKLFLFDWSGGI